MTTYAHVQNGIVREIFIMPVAWSKTPAQLFAAAVGEWVDIAGRNPQPTYGWTYDGSAFAPPPSPPTDEYLTALGYPSNVAGAVAAKASAANSKTG